MEAGTGATGKRGGLEQCFVDKPIVIPVYVARKEVTVRPCIESPAEGLCLFL